MRIEGGVSSTTVTVAVFDRVTAGEPSAAVNVTG